MAKVQKEEDWKWKDIDWVKATPDDIEKVMQSGGNVNDIGWVSDVNHFECRYVEHTPLQLAVAARNVPVVRFLLEQKADPNVVLASRHYHWGELEVLDYPLLSLALSSKNKEIIDLFFEHHVDPYIFDPEQKPRRVLQGYTNGYYVNCSVDNRSPRYLYADHPLYVALEIDDFDTLKKMTSAPYEVPDACLKGICVSIDAKAKTERYWVAFQLEKENEKRNKLRAELRGAEDNGDRVARLDALIGLRGVLNADLSDKAVKGLRREESDKYLAHVDKALDEGTLTAKEIFPVRHAYATRLKALRKNHDTATLRSVCAAMRAKVLE